VNHHTILGFKFIFLIPLLSDKHSRIILRQSPSVASHESSSLRNDRSGPRHILCYFRIAVLVMCNGSEVPLDYCMYFLALSYLLAWAALVLY
jgi:hypothetical protein